MSRNANLPSMTCRKDPGLPFFVSVITALLVKGLLNLSGATGSSQACQCPNCSSPSPSPSPLIPTSAKESHTSSSPTIITTAKSKFESTSPQPQTVVLSSCSFHTFKLRSRLSPKSLKSDPRTKWSSGGGAGQLHMVPYKKRRTVIRKTGELGGKVCFPIYSYIYP